MPDEYILNATAGMFYLPGWINENFLARVTVFTKFFKSKVAPPTGVFHIALRSGAVIFSDWNKKKKGFEKIIRYGATGEKEVIAAKYKFGV